MRLSFVESIISRLVMKFGGTSVANIERIKIVAARVAREVAAGHQVAVVVSAMSGETNKLVGFVDGLAAMHDFVEYDAIVAAGEQVTAGLTALALQELGIKARSWQGWQIPIRTDSAHGKARIESIHGEILTDALRAGFVPVIAGFQGMSPEDRITTLGRGGSDTSAVAIAAAINADRCDIFTDVDGVYTCDPRIVPKARKLNYITYDEMLESASLGAKVLQTRSVEMAMKHQVRVQVLSSFEDLPGTMLEEEEVTMEKEDVRSIPLERNEAKVTVVQVSDRPGVAAAIFGPLSAANINVDMIVQNISLDGKTTDMTFTVARNELARTVQVLNAEKAQLGFKQLTTDDKVVKVSVVGVGMKSHSGVALTMFETLAKEGINILVISTSEIKISVLIAEKYAELATRALHTAYGLDRLGE